ncbi:MAG: chemotaxis protein CheY [Symbiobacteriaceae bacterium]|jgi:DNA-binding NarL/FixJ family response regulator|nr:chemotaxis protein CheY [Symbiobacteriaceae bacterium]
MDERRIRVLLADDHNLVRAGIAGLLALEPDIDVVGEAADGIQAHAQAVALKPDVILMDLDMPRSNGFEAIATIKADLPDAIIVILTYSEDERDIAEAVRRGAQGYLLKSLEPETLAQHIRAALRGAAPMSAAVTRKLMMDLRRSEEPAEAGPGAEGGERGHLTPREMQILALIAEGATNKEIGQRIFLAENTVKNHLKHILSKLQVENRAQAVAYAFREGLLKRP